MEMRYPLATAKILSATSCLGLIWLYFVVVPLGMAACYPYLAVGEHQTMSEDVSMTPMLEKARELAWKVVKDDLADSYTYKTIVQEEESNWVFTFLPEARVRGGGAQVKVDKNQLTVMDITFLQ